MMKVYRQLVRTFLRSGEMEDPKQKKQKLFYALMGMAAMVFIMVPCCLLVGYLTYAFTLALMGNGNGLLFVVHFIALFSVVFGFHVILNVFYFAGDIPFVLPLPIAPYKVIAAKFTTAYINESVMQIMVLFSGIVGFMVAAPGEWWLYLAALVGIVTLPVAPLAYCGIVCVILMAFTKWIRNKNHARRLIMVIILLIMGVAVSSIGLLRDVDMNLLTQQLGAGKVAFVNVMNVVFPTNYWMAMALSKHSIGDFLLYLLANVGILAVFLLLAQLLYYRGLLGVGTEGNGRRKRAKSGVTKTRATKAGRQVKPWMSYCKKEFLVLFRTPAFFLNCIVVNIIWPVLFYVIRIMQSDSELFHKYYLYYRLGNETMQWIMVLIVLSVTVLLTAANSIASSAITREGKHFYVMKYIPVSYSTQLHVKAFVSIVISSGFMTVYIIVCSILMKVDNLTSWYYILVSVLEVIFITYFGLYLDTVNPKLAWDDELNALRGNTNVFFNMAYAMLVTVIFVVVLGGAYLFTRIPLTVLELVLVIIMLVADWGIVHICMKKGIKNLEELI